ncbi:RNA-dependent RNA polymerase [Wenling crustacean virus 10]|uniref:RNA-directed RNA polymerase L n=1 Tax=Wenling crustacean virus 10 TaxID=1923479 RepID=A0A1L3KN75_9RHAB|nr:RNA-dependent RNA polymerase [Wenling crustacean virus 10]APG78823.1 RNA-dependent RNA polymerase [Wenling crustacean virus 10]
MERRRCILSKLSHNKVIQLNLDLEKPRPMETTGSEFERDKTFVSFPGQTHLDVAIRDNVSNALYKFLKGDKTWTSEVKIGVRREIKQLTGWDPQVDYSTDHAKAWATLSKLLKQQPDFQTAAPSLSQFMASSDKLLKMQKESLRHFGLAEGDHLNTTLLPEFEWMWHYRHWAETGVRLSAVENMKPSELLWTIDPGTTFFTHTSKSLGTWWLGRFVCLWKPPLSQLTYALTREMFLMMSDLIHQRFIIKLATTIGSRTMPELYPSPLVLEKCWEWGDNLMMRSGNNSFYLLSQWEAIVSGCLLSIQEEQIVDNTAFLNSTIAECEKICHEKDLKVPLKPFITLLQNIGRLSSHHLSQLFGLYRTWGHPIVDLKEGIKKLRSIACVPRPFNYTWIQTITIDTISSICINYRRKKGVYPNLRLEELDDSSYLKICIESNQPIVTSHPHYNDLEWLKIKGEKTFHINDSYSLVDWLSDKALSLSHAELADEIQSHHSVGAGWKRSVLYKWLTSDIGSPQDLLEYIDKYGFPSEEDVVGVYDKERELKVLARFFGLLTLYKRMYVVVTEAMLAHDILPLFPEVTMMDDLTTLMKKIYHNTSSGEADDYWEVTYEVDFEKWNSYMREEETYRMFEFVDELYGFSRVLTRTHEMFSKSTLYLANGVYIPPVEDGRIKEGWGSWTGHLGGIEGLRQKGWTIFSLHVLKRVAKTCGVDFSIMGQGDNQVLRVKYPKSLGLMVAKEKHNLFVKTLEEILGQIGPPNKPSETWASSSCFSYGKFWVVNGVPLCMNLKRLARIFRLSNEGFPTVTSSLSSATANLMSALTSSLENDLCYFMYTTEIQGIIWYGLKYPLINLNQSPLKRNWRQYGPPSSRGDRYSLNVVLKQEDFKHVEQVSSTFLESLCIFPTSLGGYPIMMYGSTLVKGFPDPVTEALSLLKLMLRTNITPDCRRLVLNMLSPVINPYINPSMLIQDPESLNLIKESTVAERIKRHVSDYLGSAEWISNRRVAPILQYSCERQDDLCELLYQMTPLNPRIGNDVISSTVVGRALSIMSRMTKTRTLTLMALQESSVNLQKVLELTDLRTNQGVLFQLFSKEESDTSTDLTLCATLRADNLRKKSWKKPLVGVTTTCNWEAFEVVDLPCKICPDPRGYVLTHIKEGMTSSEKKGGKLGPLVPYMGSRTKEKIARGRETVQGEEGALMMKIANTLRLVGWGIGIDSNFHQLLKKILGTFSDIPSSFYETPEEMVRGTVAHRFLDERTKHGGTIPLLYQMASFIHISTSSLTAYSKGGGNVTLHFQSLMISLITAFSNLMIHQGSRTIGQHLHQVCDTCIIPVSEEMVELPESGAQLNMPRLSPETGYVQFKPSPSSDKIYTESPMKSTPAYQELIYLAGTLIVKSLAPLSYEFADGRRMIVPDTLVPILWGVKIPIQHLLFSVALAWARRITWRLLSRVNLSSDFLTGEIIVRLSRLPEKLFGSLHPFLVPTFQRFSLASPPFFCRTPSESPPSIMEVGRVLKSAIIQAWELISGTSGGLFLQGINPIANLELHPEDHPIFSIQFQEFLKTQSDDALDYLRISKEIVESVSQVNRHQVVTGEELINMFTRQNPELVTKLRTFTPKYSQFFGSVDGLVKELEDIKGSNQEIGITFLTNKVKQVSEKVMLTRENFEEGSTVLSFKTQSPFSPTTPSASGHFFKPLRFHTTSIYKLLSLSATFSTNVQKIACLGDGSGGFSLACCWLFPQASIFYNSLTSLEGIAGHSLTSASPPAFDRRPDLLSRIMNLSSCYERPSDITTEQFRDYLTEHGTSWDLVICDAEGGGWADGAKGLQIMKTIISTRAKHCLVKSYASNLPMLMAQAYAGLSTYQSVTIYRTSWSSIGNTEVYISCKDFLDTAKINWNWKDLTITVPIYVDLKTQESLMRRIKTLDWSTQLTAKDQEDASSTFTQAPDLWGRQTLIQLFPKAVQVFPDDIIKIDHSEPWVRGSAVRTRARFRQTLWTISVKRKCVKRFLIGLVASQWSNHGTLPDLHKWVRNGLFRKWKTSRGWSWIVDLEQLDERDERIANLISPSEIRILYQLGGEFGKIQESKHWANNKWVLMPVWARHKYPVKKQVSSSSNWEEQSEESQTATE